MEVPRHLPSAAVSLHRFITASQAECEREGRCGDGGGREGARAPQQKKQSLVAKVELGIRWGSETSVSARVNCLQTGCLHPLVQVHRSAESLAVFLLTQHPSCWMLPSLTLSSPPSPPIHCQRELSRKWVCPNLLQLYLTCRRRRAASALIPQTSWRCCPFG